MIVVDTHIVLWDALNPKKLSQNTKKAISKANDEDGIIFCEISLWEIAMLMQKGRIRVELPYLEFIRLVLESNRYILHGITPEIAELSSRFDADISNDPADKIIAATAVIAQAPLVTFDKKFRKSKTIATIW